jgi:hypothetical protein
MWQSIEHGFIKYGNQYDCYGKARLIEDAVGNWHLKIYDDSRLIMQLKFPKGTTTKNALMRSDDYLDDFILFVDDDES